MLIWLAYHKTAVCSGDGCARVARGGGHAGEVLIAGSSSRTDQDSYNKLAVYFYIWMKEVNCNRRLEC